VSPRRRSLAFISLLAVGIAGCSHTDPLVLGPTGEEGPLDPTPPARLTYSIATDAWPGLTLDGTRLVYTFERAVGDPDRCLGVLPGGGGQRLAEVCPEIRADRDAMEHGAVSPGGRLAFTAHRGVTGGFSTVEAALYIAPVDSVAGATKVFDLISTPAGAPRRWDYLLDPVWLSETELAFIGTQVAYIPPAPFADPDTVYTGIDLATVRLDGGTPTITVVATVGNAQAMSYDPTAERFTFLRNDSVYTVPRTGGGETFVYALPEVAGEFGKSITGVASGGGRLWITWTRTVTVGTSSTLTSSTVSEVGAGGALTNLAVRERFVPSGGTPSDEGTWGRLSADGDGTRLVVEGLGGPTGNDLYLFELE
jgi:hypothetical protein